MRVIRTSNTNRYNCWNVGWTNVIDLDGWNTEDGILSGNGAAGATG